MRRGLDFQAVFERSPNPYMLLDRDLRYVAANDAYLAATGKTRDELIGARITDVFQHDASDPGNESRRRLEASFTRVLATGQPDVLPFIHYRIPRTGSDGASMEDRYWSATHTPLFGEDGAVEHILQHTVDVTTMHTLQDGAGVLARAERLQERTEDLDKSNAWMNRMFADAPVALALFQGPNLVVRLANARIGRMWGRSPEEVTGRALLDAMPELRGQGFAELLAEVRTTGKPYFGTERAVMLARGPQGTLEKAYFDFVYQPFDGNAVLAVATEVTDLVVARKKSEAAKAELEAIFESFPEAVLVGDATGVKRANAPARALLGYESAEEVLRDQPTLVRELAPRTLDGDEPIDVGETPYARALRGEATRSHITIERRGTCERRTVYSSGAPVRAGGEIVGAVVTQIDVTDQKQAESDARKLARVLDATHDFVGIADIDGNPTFVNQAALDMMGFDDAATARALHMLEYFAPADRERVTREVVPAALDGGYWEGELRFLHRKTGEELPVLYSIFPLKNPQGRVKALATITRDLRAQKAAESERARLLANERAARAQAEEASSLKDEFLAVVSHELRTPLTSILGWIQLLRSGMLAADKRDRALDTIERNARVQAQLIDDLLDVSRIVSGKLDFEMENTDVASVLAAAAETVRPVATEKGIELCVAVEPGLTLKGDANRLQQVVWNLLTNAVKFTPRGGHVSLTSDRHGDDVVEIVVRDSGIGIAPEFLPHVFERFRQAEGDTRRALGGLGLGLSIVQHVVTAHGGEVTAESEGRGHGATFRVRLPLARGLRPHTTDHDAYAPTPEVDGLHVLVVDDEDDIRELVAVLLRRANAKVTSARSVAEAMQLVERERPDVVVSDIAMPQEDGYALVRRLRALKDGELARTPAVALTAHARPEDRTRALRAGFQNHVTKPIDPGELLAVIASQTVRA